MIKRLLCLAVTVTMLLVFTTACFGNKDIIEGGNVSEMSGPEPGDIYAVFQFLDFEDAVTFKLFPDIAPVAVKEFVTRAERGFYDGRNIHRVVADKFIQGGSINFDGTDGEIEGEEFYGIETSDSARNFYGALSLVANSENNNYCQFFIVTNKHHVDIDAQIHTAEEMLKGSLGQLNDQAKVRIERNLTKMMAIPEDVKQQYLTRGGDYELDGTVTVFGQLVEGSEVIDAIAAVEVAAGNQIDDEINLKSKPIEEIIIKSVKIIKIPFPELEETTTSRSRATSTSPPITDVIGDLTEKVNLDELVPVPIEDGEEDNSNQETNDNIESGEESSEEEIPADEVSSEEEVPVDEASSEEEVPVDGASNGEEVLIDETDEEIIGVEGN